MNEAKFLELANLYFDQEIAPAELEQLRDELARCPARRREFEARYRLHQGMRVALAADVVKNEQRRARAAKKRMQVLRVSAWALGSGLAACLALGVLIFRPVVQKPHRTLSAGQYEVLKRVDGDRFAAARAAPHNSLIAELRLMGLTPDMVPVGRQMQHVDVEAMRQREVSRQRVIERLNQYQAYSAMPETRVFESLPQPLQRQLPAQRWPAGFQSSLASF